MKPSTFILISAVAACAVSVHAQGMKPGLWEINSKIGGSAEMDQAMVKMQAQLAAMPPAQRKMMEDVMAKQGMSMPGTGANGGMLVKTCVTKEMAARSQMPVQQQGDCTSSVSDKTSSSMKVKFSCTNPPSNGEGLVTFTGDTAYAMKMNVSSSRQGAPKMTTIEGTGKFLGSDCGSVKPMALPKQP